VPDTIVIVSLAPWARRGTWWRAAGIALRDGRLERPAELLLRYLQDPRNGDRGAISLTEATLLRGWASSLPGWRERAERGQYPLRFTAYSLEARAAAVAAD
jgi:hypothetical protein